MVSKKTISKKRRKEGCIINCLPGDLLEGIFLRLPVSTLLKCIGVCKKWHNFIRDPLFATLHLQQAPPCTLLFFPPELVSGKHYPADAILIDEAWSQSTWTVPVIRPDDFLFGSCNGLLGLYTNTTTIKIANLATGECLHLVKPVKNLKGDHFSFYSFGFHPVTKEYKITHFLGDYVDGRPHNKDRFNVIQVYKLGEEKWRDVRTPVSLSFSCVKCSGVANVDGTMYWLTDMVTSRQHAVMSFDLREESFAWIQLPTGVLEECERDVPCRFWIREIEGKVCVATAQISRYPPGVLVGKLQIWTLDDKEEERWSQKYSIQNSPQHIPGPHFVHRDKILTQRHDGCLHSYALLGENSEIKDMVKLLDFSPRKPDNMQLYIFVKSLVRLDVYRKATIVRRPKQRDGWELKKWQSWKERLCKMEDFWSRIHKVEHDTVALAHSVGITNQVVQQQQLANDVILRPIFMELNKFLQYMVDDADQPRSLRRPNWVEQKRDLDKLLARLDRIEDMFKVMNETKNTFGSPRGGSMLDQGTSSSAADN